jgi:hypothetical protein
MLSTVKHLSDGLRKGFSEYGAICRNLSDYKIKLAETLAAELTLPEFLENKHRLVKIYLQNTLSSNEYERYIETERLHNFKGSRNVEEKAYQIVRSRLTSECIRKIDKIGILAYDYHRPKKTNCSSDDDFSDAETPPPPPNSDDDDIPENADADNADDSDDDEIPPAPAPPEIADAEHQNAGDRLQLRYNILNRNQIKNDYERVKSRYEMKKRENEEVISELKREHEEAISELKRENKEAISEVRKSYKKVKRIYKIEFNIK